MPKVKTTVKSLILLLELEIEEVEYSLTSIWFWYTSNRNLFPAEFHPSTNIEDCRQLVNAYLTNVYAKLSASQKASLPPAKKFDGKIQVASFDNEKKFLEELMQEMLEMEAIDD